MGVLPLVTNRTSSSDSDDRRRGGGEPFCLRQTPVLASRIAAAGGDKPAAIASLRDAVATQDQLLYDEPSDWPVRESLGGMLLESGDAKGAEQVFRDDLERNPRNPRSLFGLAEALKRRQLEYEASWIRQQFQAAWQGADLELRVADL